MTYRTSCQYKMRHTQYRALLQTRQAVGDKFVAISCEAIPSAQAWLLGQVAILVNPDTGDHTFHALTDALMLTALANMLSREK